METLAECSVFGSGLGGSGLSVNGCKIWAGACCATASILILSLSYLSNGFAIIPRQE